MVILMKTKFVKAAVLAASLLVQAGVQCNPVRLLASRAMTSAKLMTQKYGSTGALKAYAGATTLGAGYLGYKYNRTKSELYRTKAVLNKTKKELDIEIAAVDIIREHARWISRSNHTDFARLLMADVLEHRRGSPEDKKMAKGLRDFYENLVMEQRKSSKSKN